MFLSPARCYCMAHYTVPLDNSGPWEVSSRTTAWSKLSHEVRPGLRTLSCEDWKPYQEGITSLPAPSGEKNLPFISHHLTLLSLLHTVSPSSTGIAARQAEPQCSCLNCVWVLLSPSSLCPGPSQ